MNTQDLIAPAVLLFLSGAAAGAAIVRQFFTPPPPPEPLPDIHTIAERDNNAL